MNGGKIADPSDKSTLEELLKQDVTTPGFVRLPVCSPERAFDSWLGVNRKPDTSAPNYPCSLKLGIGNCGSTDIVDQTSDASPKVSDCMQIIKNIEGTDGEWSVEAVVGSHHQIAEHASCRFGVQAKSVNGNAQFFVGAQDIIDIINDSVRQFGGSGRVGTKGTMSCKGSVKGQDIEWGLF